MKIKFTHFFKNCYFVLITLGCMFTFESCEKEKDNPENKPIAKSLSAPEIPTEDELTVKSTLKTFIATGEYNGFGKALTDRMISKSTVFDGSVRVAILNDKGILSMSNQDYLNLIEMMVSGGSVVYLNPTPENFQAMTLTLFLAIQNMYEEGEFDGAYNENVNQLLESLYELALGGGGMFLPFFGDSQDTNSIICEAIAINNNSYCIIDDLGDKDKTKTILTTVDDNGNQTSVDMTSETSTREMTPYQYGEYADELTSWLNEQSETTMMQNKRSKDKAHLLAQLRTDNGGESVSALDDVCSPQDVKYVFYAETPLYGGSVPVTVIYQIWAVYSPSKKSDYYLIRQETRAENSSLGCGPNDAEVWYKYPPFETAYNFKKGLTYGCYMSGLKVLNKSVEGAQELTQVSPNNDISGASSYTEGFDWGIDVGLFIAKDPALNIGGSVGFSKSWTTNIPDLDMTFRYNGTTPEWYYKGDQPESRWAIYIKHDIAKKILISDCTVGQCWIWKCEVNNPNAAFSFESTINYDSQMLGYSEGFFKTYPLYVTRENVQKYTIRLTAPPRAVQKWQMDCKPYSASLQNFLAVNYGNYWRPYFSLCTETASSKEEIDSCIKAFGNSLNKSMNKWINAGYAGKTFVFSWKEEDSYTAYREFTFTIPNE